MPFGAVGEFQGTTSPSSGGSGGGISEITSTDDSVTITDSTGPITDLSVSGGSTPTPVLFGISNQPPGAAMASFVNEGLSTMTPLPSLFDGAPLIYWQSLQTQDGVILAGTEWTSTPFIGHDLSIFYRSTDGGQTWTGVSTPWDSFVSVNVYGVAFGAGGDVMAVVLTFDGTNTVFAVGWSTDSGQTWTDITADSPLSAGAPNGNNGSCAFDGSVWYLAANPPVSGVGLWTATDPTNPASWTAQTTGITGEVVSFVVATPTVAMAVGIFGASSPLFVLSTDHGATWTNPANPFDTAGFSPNWLVTDGSGNWLAWTQEAGTASFMVQSLDDGANWGAPITLPTFVSQASAVFLSGTGWVTVWGSNGDTGTNGTPLINPLIIYSAPVADPLVITPTGYVADAIYCPAALVPV